MQELLDAVQNQIKMIELITQAVEGLITDQELCNQLEQITNGKIEREVKMPTVSELDHIKDLCDRFVIRDRLVSWIDVGVAILKLKERDQFILSRMISSALKSSDHSNV